MFRNGECLSCLSSYYHLCILPPHSAADVDPALVQQQKQETWNKWNSQVIKTKKLAGAFESCWMRKPFVWVVLIVQLHMYCLHEASNSQHWLCWTLWLVCCNNWLHVCFAWATVPSPNKGAAMELNFHFLLNNRHVLLGWSAWRL